MKHGRGFGSRGSFLRVQGEVIAAQDGLRRCPLHGGKRCLAYRARVRRAGEVGALNGLLAEVLCVTIQNQRELFAGDGLLGVFPIGNAVFRRPVAARLIPRGALGIDPVVPREDGQQHAAREAILGRKLVVGRAGDQPPVAVIVKAADKLSAYLKCVEELKAGNTEFTQAEKQTYKALVDMKLPCLDYFMEHFLESFRLTLDEL